MCDYEVRDFTAHDKGGRRELGRSVIGIENRMGVVGVTAGVIIITTSHYSCAVNYRVGTYGNGTVSVSLMGKTKQQCKHRFKFNPQTVY